MPDEERVKIILDHLRLARSMARQFPTECTSAAYEGLCYAADRIQKEGLSHDNIGGYLAVFIKRYIHNELAVLTVVTSPRRGERIKTLEARDIQDHRGPTDFQDLIEHLTPLEQRICTLRVEGYTIREVAKILGVTQKRAFDLLTEVRRKLR